MQIKDKNKVSYLLSIVILLANCFMVRPQVSFTNSGIISFYLSELVGICVTAFICLYFLYKWKDISKENKSIALFAVIFNVYCIIIYAIRTVTQGLELKSILIFESNMLLIGFMFLITFRILSLHILINSMTVFSCLVGLISVFLFYFTGQQIAEIILFNHATRTYLLGVLLPLTVYQYILSKNAFSAICLYVHFATLIFCGMVSGARLNYFFIPVILIGSLILLSVNKLFFIRYAVISFLIPVMVIFISANYSLVIYAQLTRLPITNSVVQLFHIKYIDNTDTSGYENLTPEEEEIYTLDLSSLIEKSKSADIPDELRSKIIKQIVLLSAKESTGESSSLRFFAWRESVKDISKNPLFGIGLRQYTASSSDGQLTVDIHPHNFILEYSLSFGIIGFLLWAFMIISPLFLSLKKIKFQFWHTSAGWCTLLSLFFACTGAFFQPYFLYACVMTIMYLLIGIYSLVITEN